MKHATAIRAVWWCGLGLGAALLSLAPTRAIAQGAPTEQEEPAVTPDEQVEAFLRDHDLEELLAAQLRQRLAAARGADRLPLAERLGQIYVSLMGATRDPARLERLERLGRELIETVPEAQTYALRLDLAKARYLVAEGVVEDSIVRLATPAALQDAERALRTVVETFDEVGRESHRRVENLDRLEERGRLEGDPAAREALAEARRLRSLAHYYAGWTRYYLAVLAADRNIAQASLVDFGWLLSAETGQAPTIDRFPKALLRYEHIARAAIGCALASSIRGSSVDAIRWLEEVDSNPDTPENVREQVFRRRIAILCQSRRWADLAWQIERVRRSRASGSEPGRLTIREARLLAVGTLEALREPGAPAERAEIAEGLAQGALADLVAAGQVAHVLDLVQRYGTAPIGNEGFIVAYVRGLQTYDEARARHQGSGQDPSAPAATPELVNAYRQASDLLGAALESQDAARFEAERAQCGMMRGFALYYAGDFPAAADALERAASVAGDPSDAEEALWVAIVALDQGVEGGQLSLGERRDRLALLFLQEHPSSPRAAELLLRRASAGLIDDEQAVQILLSVERASPVYLSARRRAVALLYRLYRRALGPERDFAALRLADVAEEVIRLDAALATSARGQEAADAAASLVLHARQVLDALLGASAPDLQRAESMLETVERVLGQSPAIAPPEVAEELAYRRVQIALARGDDTQISRRLDELRAMDGRLSQTADRLIYSRASRAWQAAPEDVALARAVVSSGQRVIEQYPAPPEAFQDPVVAPLYATVAEAAAVVWRADQNGVFRDMAVRLDRALVENDRATASTLRRVARLSESGGDTGVALDAWRRLLSGLPAGQPEWFEARYESLRLLAGQQPAAARQALDQHKILYPEFGPEPWGQRLRDLDEQIPRAPETSPTAPSSPR
ncbi:MAG: hypothetical protein H6809_00030 [Phycisphaeraceae bacterium]|nr:hypothetical protein [Phycisphaeraceae bacterium]